MAVTPASPSTWSPASGAGGWWGRLADVPGVAVGHAGRADGGWLSGVTVVLPPPATIGAVDVRGGGPATRETDALAPSALVSTVDAVCLTGGSAFGLAAADGVVRWCEERGRGFAVRGATPGALVVPIVPTAAVFDLGRGGDAALRPDAALGYAACEAASGGFFPSAAAGGDRGGVGAGTGALLARQLLGGGIGQASVRVPLPGGGVATVGALVVLNAVGSPVDPVDGSLAGHAFVPAGLPRPQVPTPAEADAVRRALTRPDSATLVGGDPPPDGGPRSATTLAVVATDAALDRSDTWRTATAAHDGLARALRPVHTLFDGDTVFALSTGTVPIGDGPVGLVVLQAAAADAVLLAVLDAVLCAPPRRTPTVDVPAYHGLAPSSTPTPP